MTDAVRRAPSPGLNVRALVLAAHPAPCLAVATFALLLAVAAGVGARTSVLITAAVLSGQLAIGWSNDRLDVRRDRAVGRVDKPLANGRLSLRIVDAAVAAALVATVVLSLSIGLRAGLLHLVAVLFGLLYNIALKSTWWSWLPYAAAFGALPGVATLAGPGHPGPAGWLVAAGASLGVTAHLMNALPDLGQDARTGVRGLPQRLGASRSLTLASILLLVGSLVIVFGPPRPPTAGGWIGLAVDVVAAIGGLAWQRNRPPSRAAFLGVIVVVAVNLILLVVRVT